MRPALFPLLALLLIVAPAQAQSIIENLPPGLNGDAPAEVPPPAKEVPSADTFTVADVSADVTADSAAHARDQALMQAERTAFSQLCTRLSIPDNAAKLDDDSIAALVQSFELQSEHVSKVRYIGVFTIRFKPSAVQKKLAKFGDLSTASAGGDAAKPLPSGPLSHIAVAVPTDSLAGWAQTKKRLNAVPQIAKIDTIDLGRGVSHIDVAYTGTPEDLQQVLSAQGFVLRHNYGGDWELYDGSMVPR
jgi:hypothetical protein